MPVFFGAARAGEPLARALDYGIDLLHCGFLFVFTW
jgi:hypothetical protein